MSFAISESSQTDSFNRRDARTTKHARSSSSYVLFSNGKRKTYTNQRISKEAKQAISYRVQVLKESKGDTGQGGGGDGGLRSLMENSL